LKYLYVIHIPVYLVNGDYLMERAAVLDLTAHIRLLPAGVKLILAAPVLYGGHQGSLSGPLDSLDGMVKMVELRYVNSLLQGVKSYGHNLKQLTAAIKEADFVHTGCGGFPYFFSPCYQAHRLAKKFHKTNLYVMDCDLVGKLEMDQVSRTTNPVKKFLWYLFAKLSWKMYTTALRTASVTFLLGQGVVSRYGKYACNPMEIYQPIVGEESMIGPEEFGEKLAKVGAVQPISICFAGRLAPEKGLDVLLRGMAEIASRISIVLNVYGDGPQRYDSEQLASELGIGDMVHFHGNLDWGESLFTQLRKNHIQIIPHLTLEMTRNAFDGMASGCALVVSDTPALQKLIVDSQAGVVFHTGDHVDLADKLVSMLVDSLELTRCMENGVSFVRENHRDTHVRRRLEFLTRCFPGVFPSVEGE